MLKEIRAHSKIVDVDGVQVGVVDSVEDNRIKITRAGSDDGRHHFIPDELIESIDQDTVRLSVTAEQALDG